MKNLKRNLLIWLVGVLICLPLTLIMVQVAYQQRGYWAIGGEYSLIPLAIVVCTWVIDHFNREDAKNRGLPQEKRR